MADINAALRLARTLQPLSARQVATRALHTAQRKLWRWTGAQRDDSRPLKPRELCPLWTGLAALSERSNPPSWVSEERQKAREVMAGVFEFLEERHTFPSGIQWHLPSAPQLWRYHLQYFGYVRSLLVAAQAGGGREEFDTFKLLVRSWNEGNRALRGDGWHPYTLSLRSVNWLQGWSIWRREIERDGAFCRSFLGSLCAQGRGLYQQMEFDVRGNHLLENLRALIWLGCAFKGAEPQKWFRVALQHLRAETDEQILADGGHFERTPGYHLVVLRDYLEIALLLERNGDGCPGWLRSSVQRQAEFLEQLLGPARRIPLLKDTAYDAAPDPGDVLAAVARWLGGHQVNTKREPGRETFLCFGPTEETIPGGRPAAPPDRGLAALRQTGFYVVRNDVEHGVFDVGRPCPDYLPAHAHADTFSYEYHFGNQPVVVDSGVYAYQRGPWRDYFRSTRAHNTVSVDAGNSSEVWSSFRVGRKARPRILEEESGHDYFRMLAEHDGFRYLPGRPVHRRAFIWRAQEYLLIVDEVSGQGVHSVTNYVHFHPEVAPERQTATRWLLPLRTTTLFMEHAAVDDTHCRRGQELPEPQGWYSETFGRKVPNAVLCLTHRSSLPLLMVYVITPHAALRLNLATNGRDVLLQDKRSGRATTFALENGRLVTR